MLALRFISILLIVFNVEELLFWDANEGAGKGDWLLFSFLIFFFINLETAPVIVLFIDMKLLDWGTGVFGSFKLNPLVAKDYVPGAADGGTGSGVPAVLFITILMEFANDVGEKLLELFIPAWWMFEGLG